MPQGQVQQPEFYLTQGPLMHVCPAFLTLFDLNTIIKMRKKETKKGKPIWERPKDLGLHLQLRGIISCQSHAVFPDTCMLTFSLFVVIFVCVSALRDSKILQY